VSGLQLSVGVSDQREPNAAVAAIDGQVFRRTCAADHEAAARGAGIAAVDKGGASRSFASFGELL
jgi:hypothetical protein